MNSSHFLTTFFFISWWYMRLSSNQYFLQSMSSNGLSGFELSLSLLLNHQIIYSFKNHSGISKSLGSIARTYCSKFLYAFVLNLLPCRALFTDIGFISNLVIFLALGNELFRLLFFNRQSFIESRVHIKPSEHQLRYAHLFNKQVLCYFLWVYKKGAFIFTIYVQSKKIKAHICIFS